MAEPTRSELAARAGEGDIDAAWKLVQELIGERSAEVVPPRFAQMRAEEVLDDSPLAVAIEALEKIAFAEGEDVSERIANEALQAMRATTRAPVVVGHRELPPTDAELRGMSWAPLRWVGYGRHDALPLIRWLALHQGKVVRIEQNPVGFRAWPLEGEVARLDEALERAHLWLECYVRREWGALPGEAPPTREQVHEQMRKWGWVRLEREGVTPAV